MSQLLLETPLEGEQKGLAKTLYRSANTLLTVLNDMLDISKLEAGELELEPSSFDLSQGVQEVIKSLTPHAEEKGLALECEVDEDLITWVIGDRRRINQVLTNLITNAIKFTPKGQVRVLVKGHQELTTMVQFEIIDTGVGIPDNQLDDIFNSFHQIDTSYTRKHEGTGLGLSISKQLLALMEGEIGVESTLGHGAKFWFRIPLTKSLAPEVDTPRSPATSLHILVVDDNPVNLKVTSRVLERMGHTTQCVVNGKQALESLQETPFDLVLMDVQMPELDGYQATQAIRKQDATVAHTPIVALTAHAMSGDREQCLKAGMDDYLTKPIQREQLERVLTQLPLYRQKYTVEP